jgi:hypothetical protein
MKIKHKIFVTLIPVLLSVSSCKKVKEYFHDPETEPVAHAVKTSAAIAYSASVEMSVMSGEQLPFVITTGDCSNYPCTSLSIVTVSSNQVLFSAGSIGEITIAALWPDEDVGIMTILFTDIDISTQNFKLLSIHTVPVIKEEERLVVVFSENDINIGSNPDQLLEMDLSEGEIEFELARLEYDTPENLYVAVEQNAWIISIDQNGTLDDFRDDSYLITGGGQIIKVTGASGGIIQQALLSVELNSYCQSNPVSGFALIKNTKAEEKKIPELGTAVFEFHNHCDGKADVAVATGVYIKSNGKSLPLGLD